MRTNRDRSRSVEHVFLASVFVLISFLPVHAQDGSDIKYIKTADVDETYVGKFVHFDFGDRSFIFSRDPGQVTGDRTTIKIDKKKIVFIEHRVDDGYNNWFRQQYLESIDLVDGLRLRLTKSKLLTVTGDKIGTESYFDFYDASDKMVPGRSFTRRLSFSKNEIVEVLVSSKSHD